jgi:hypothetical protein
MSTPTDCADLESPLELRPDLLKKAVGRWGSCGGEILTDGRIKVGDLITKRE